MDAKRFLVARIAAEAERRGAPLSELEQQELFFTETHETLPDIMDINARFDEKYDAADYEEKITKLMRSAHDHDAKASLAEHDQWHDAVRRLEPEDHYILVMLHAAGITGRRQSGSHKAKAPRKPGALNMKIVLGLAAAYLVFLVASNYVDERFGLRQYSSRYHGARGSSGFLLFLLMGIAALGYLIFDALSPLLKGGRAAVKRESVFRRAGFIALALWGTLMAVVAFVGPFHVWTHDQQIGFVAWTLLVAAAIAAAISER